MRRCGRVCLSVFWYLGFSVYPFSSAVHISLSPSRESTFGIPLSISRGVITGPESIRVRRRHYSNLSCLFTSPRCRQPRHQADPNSRAPSSPPERANRPTSPPPFSPLPSHSSTHRRRDAVPRRGVGLWRLFVRCPRSGLQYWFGVSSLLEQEQEQERRAVLVVVKMPAGLSWRGPLRGSWLGRTRVVEVVQQVEPPPRHEHRHPLPRLSASPSPWHSPPPSPSPSFSSQACWWTPE